MKTLVIYKSKTGYAKTYAEWIAKDLKCDIKENKNLKLRDIKDYDTIIYGAGIYMGKVAGLKLIKKNYDDLKNKNLIVWASGADPGNEETIEEFWANNFPDGQISNVKKYYMRGGFDYGKLGPADKVLMNMFKKSLEKQENPSDDVKGFINAYYKPQDYCKPENVRPLTEYVKSLE